MCNSKRNEQRVCSTQLIRENQAIAVEDLNIKGMQAGRLGKSIGDAGWGQFISMLEYKAQWYGRTIIKADRFYPSSKRCHCCGWINQGLRLKDRTWECGECHTTLDRDINAARNLLIFTGGLPGIHAQGDLALAGSMN